MWYKGSMGVNRELIKTKDLMDMLNISKPQVYKFIRSKTITAVDVSRAGAKRPRYRFYKDEIEKLIKDREI
jgi:hypothetical protein